MTIIYYCDECDCWEKIISHGVPVNECGHCGNHGLSYVGMSDKEYIVYLKLLHESDDKRIREILPLLRKRV